MIRSLTAAALVSALSLAGLSAVTPVPAHAEMAIRLEKKVVEDLRRGDRDAVTAYLLSNGNPGARDDDGQPLLVIATRLDKPGIVNLLLHHKARVDMPDRMGNTALYWAADTGTVAIARALIEAGADVNAQNRQGFTPLMAAARGGSLPVVRALIAAGADPRLADYTGRDAFGWATGPHGPMIVNEMNKAS